MVDDSLNSNVFTLSFNLVILLVLQGSHQNANTTNISVIQTNRCDQPKCGRLVDILGCMWQWKIMCLTKATLFVQFVTLAKPLSLLLCSRPQKILLHSTLSGYWECLQVWIRRRYLACNRYRTRSTTAVWIYTRCVK